MDWPLAIERNREALKRIVAALFALAAAALLGSPGLSRRSRDEGAGAVVFLPRHFYASILLILRPAESAVRRLIVIAACGLVSKPHGSRPHPANLPAFAAHAAFRTPAFTLLDPLKHFTLDDYNNNALPHVSFHSGSDAEFHATHLLLPGEPVDTSRLFVRLRALRHALGDLPRQARRLVRWQARRDAALKANGPTRMSPVRPGLPPGWRERSIHEVDGVLRECHGLAIHALNGHDTG